MERIPYQDLTTEQRELVDLAREALQRAYNPHSNTTVGAAVRTKRGNLYSGGSFRHQHALANVCGERVAALAAHAADDREIVSIATVATSKNGPKKDPTPPCGVCREFLLEFPNISGQDLEVLYSNTDGSVVCRTYLSKLMPDSFRGSEISAWR